VPIERGHARANGSRGAEPSITELVSELREETTHLLRKEVELARLEITTSLARLQTAVSSFAVGAVAAVAGVLFLLAAAALGLDLVLQKPWLSTLIVGAVALVLGAVCFAFGRSWLVHLTPERSMHSLREDTHLVQEHLPGGGS
jgi:membrane-bound ClpP family serine protease